LGGASSFPIRYIAPPQLVHSLFILKHWRSFAWMLEKLLEVEQMLRRTHWHLIPTNTILRKIECHSKRARVTHWYKYFRCYQKHKSFRLTQFWYPIFWAVWGAQLTHSLAVTLKDFKEALKEH
jgi:hypothetical protein